MSPLPDIREVPPLTGPEYGPPGAPYTTVNPDLPGVWRWGYNSHVVKVYETREVVLPNMYLPRRHFAPLGFTCDDCGAGQGHRCWDLRSNGRLFRLRPHRARRLILLTGPARLVRWPVWTRPGEGEDTLW